MFFFLARAFSNPQTTVCDAAVQLGLLQALALPQHPIAEAFSSTKQAFLNQNVV